MWEDQLYGFAIVTCVIQFGWIDWCNVENDIV